MTFAEQQARRRRALIGIIALCGCCSSPCGWLPGRMLASSIVADLFYDRGETLREKTGLVLPRSARGRDFHYSEGLRGDAMSLSFDAPEGEAKAFLRQGPLASAAWEEWDDRLADERDQPPDPKGVHRVATVEPSRTELIQVEAKDRKDGTWTIWVYWSIE